MDAKEKLESILMGDRQIESLEHELFAVMPELIVCKNCAQNLPAHRAPVLAHTYEVVDGVKKEIRIKLAALLHDIGKPYVRKTINGVDCFKGHEKVSELLAGLILQRMKYDDAIGHDVCLLVRYHDAELFPAEKSMQDMAQKIGWDLLLPLLELQWSDLLAHSAQKINAFMSRREAAMAYYLENFANRR